MPEHFLTTWDRSVFIAINHHMKSPALDFVMPRISDLGLGHVQVLALLLFALYRGRVAFAKSGCSVWQRLKEAFGSQRRWLVPMLVAFALSGVGATAFKRTVQRDRPYWFYTNSAEGRALKVKIYTVADRPPMRVRGFLSGHTATSVALAATATVLLWRRRKRGLIAAVWITAAVISFSRIYLADHWPIDVAAGALMGLICTFVALGLCRGLLHSSVDEPASESGQSPQISQCATGSV